MTQKRNDINAGTYVGKGKVAEIVEKVKLTDADVVVFDNDFHLASDNLEKATEVKVLDRSELILDIFATGRTPESRLQVELAQLEYSLPRLKQMWTIIEGAQARPTMLPDLRHIMTPADTLNACDGPLAATKPPEDLAAEPIGNTSRTRRCPGSGIPPARRTFHYRCSRQEPRASARSKASAHHCRRHSIPIAGTTVPRFSPIRF